MKEEESIREAVKAKDYRKAQLKYTTEINSLNFRLKHENDQKEDAAQFEQQLQKIRKEQDDNEKKWSEEHTKFSEEVVEMTTDLWKLWTEIKERNKELEQLKREKAIEESALTELQSHRLIRGAIYIDSRCIKINRQGYVHVDNYPHQYHY